MIGTLILDLTQTSLERIREIDPKSVEDVRNAMPLIAFSDDMTEKSRLLKKFLFENLYRPYQVNRMIQQGAPYCTPSFLDFYGGTPITGAGISFGERGRDMKRREKLPTILPV